MGLVCNHKKTAGAGLEAPGASTSALAPPRPRQRPSGARSAFHTYLSSTSSQMTNRTATSMWSRPRPKPGSLPLENASSSSSLTVRRRGPLPPGFHAPHPVPSIPRYVHARAGSSARATGQGLVEFSLMSPLRWDMVTCPLPPFSPQNLHDPMKESSGFGVGGTSGSE